MAKDGSQGGHDAQRGKMPKYTVIMAAKNSSATIGRAVTSVLAGLPSDSEVVIWDDGSTDGTGEIAIRAAGDRKVRVLSSDYSVGSGQARQNIINATDSEYVINMDSDDVSMPWRFHFQLPEMDRSDFCFSASFRFSRWNVLKKPTLPLSYQDLETRVSLAFHNGLTHSSMVARRSVLVDIGGYRNLPVAQDYELWLRAASRGARFRRVGLPCIAYRMSPTQISNQEGYVERILRRPELLNSYLDLIQSLKPAEDFVVSPGASHSATLDTVSGVLPQLLPAFRPHLRRYYAALLSEAPLGPFEGLARL